MNKNSVYRAILDNQNAEVKLLDYAHSGKEDTFDNFFWYAKRNIAAIELDSSSDSFK